MQIRIGFRIISIALFVAPSPSHSQQPRVDRGPWEIVNRKFGFSIARPKRWYVYEGGDLPMLFNYSAESALPWGDLPPGGARILMLVRDSNDVHDRKDALSSAAEYVVWRSNGIHPQQKFTSGPTAIPSAKALCVSFERPAPGPDDQSLRVVAIAWKFKDKVFIAQLSYVIGDPGGERYERALSEVVRSFKPD